MSNSSERAAVYTQLESKMLRYADYAHVGVKEINEPMVPISSRPYLVAQQIGNDMQEFTGDQVFVRKSVLEKLDQAAGGLQSEMSGACLSVVYGYRALSIQRRLFDAVLATCGDVEEAHRKIAVPDVAGHPTGGAVDIQITDTTGRALDFGTPIWSFEQDSYTFSPFISETATRNRALLRSIMLGVGFAPFDGEWWHFSYGDREWAHYYGQANARYQQIEFKSITGVV